MTPRHTIEHPRYPGYDPRAGAPSIAIVNPATGAVIAEVVSSTGEDVDAAVQAAERGAELWRSTSGSERARVLGHLADLIEERFEDLALMDTHCTGKTVRDSRAEAYKAAEHARFWGGHTEKVFGETFADPEGRFSFSRREPLGVYAVIIPWNGPTTAFMARAMPPLACGNAVIVKPSELSPLSALRLADLAREAGVPEGALSILTGGGEVGAALSTHPGIRGVSFTGSVETGRKVGEMAAATFKKVTLELGGKSPIIVFEDADLESAALGALMGVSFNAGQICAASTRLLVQDTVADEFYDLLVRRAAGVRVGDPYDPETHMGPVACQSQFDKVGGFIERGVAAGGKVLLGAQPARATTVFDGLYISPTVLTGLERTSEAVQHEIFGPVLVANTFSTEDEAVLLANDTEFGLASYVWTNDVGRMFRMIERLDTGIVHGNTTLVIESKLPFGGLKNSGVGGAYGLGAVDAYTRVKRATIRTAAGPLPSPWPGV